jgi:D-glycero-alpha-D-manno-heptose-7-phosphate kinase
MVIRNGIATAAGAACDTGGNTETIRSKAPTRIDLAGGTLDLWPIYLFLDQPLTLNIGIDLFAEADLEIKPAAAAGAGRITLRSDDQNMEIGFSIDELLAPETPTVAPGVELHTKLFRHFAAQAARTAPDAIAQARTHDLTLRTRAKSPAGAGLGGSSTLSVAIVGALATWAKGEKGRAQSVDPARDGEHWIEIIRDVETTVIRVPAGLQDYYGAMFGGLQALRWRAGKHEREQLDASILKDLERRLLLFYSGHSRNSGINNWALFKAFIDGQESVREKFKLINSATQSLERALRARDWQGAGRAIGEEWAARKTLATGITTPEIDAALDKAARAAKSPISAKICGAGGGGCFFVYSPSGDAAEMAAIQSAVTAMGIRSLPFQASPIGLQVTRA